jgi:hypothetical protein
MVAPAAPAPLPLDRWADALAHAIYFGLPRRAEVLTRLAISEPDFTAADAAWNAALVAEALEDAHPVADAFAAAFAPVIKRLKAEKPPIESIGALPVEAAPLASEPEVPPGAAAELTLAAEAQPTFLASQAVPAQSTLSGERWARWAGVHDAGRTNQVDVTQLMQAALPFMSNTSGTPGPAARAHPGPLPVVKRAPAALSGTRLDEIASKGPPLPFASAAPSPVAARLPPVVRAPAALTGTSMAHVEPKAPVLPFAHRVGAPASAEAQVEPPALTLQQYASLSVEIGQDPAKEAEICARYGLSAAFRESAERHWRARLEAEPAARAAFDQACATYRAWLASRGGSVP